DRLRRDRRGAGDSGRHREDPYPSCPSSDAAATPRHGVTSRRVVLLAGPSGSGKSRVAARLGWPVLRLDEFYRDGDAPDLPMRSAKLVDWDEPRSWDADAAVAAIEELCRNGSVEAPIYEIASNTRIGVRTLRLGNSPVFIAEGIF